MGQSLPKTNDNRPIFKFPVEPEFTELQEEVSRLVHKLRRKKHRIIQLKILLFPALYAGTYTVLLLQGEDPVVFYLAYIFLGLFLLLNFLNLIHDAVHGVTFKKHRQWNKIFLYLFDLLGANSYIWKIRHLRLHHAFPNIMGWDSDLEQSPLVRIFPQSSRKKIQRYQHIYLPFLYPLYLFNWLLIRDFKDYFGKNRIVQQVVEIPKREYLKLFFFKFIFFGYIMVVPKYTLGVSWWAVLAGFILLMFTASITSLLVLLSPHASIESEFPQRDGQGKLPHTWFMHQLLCTNDVSNDNFFVRFFMASFNYHIVHHLFPYIHHSYYPEITENIERFYHPPRVSL